MQTTGEVQYVEQFEFSVLPHSRSRRKLHLIQH